MKRYLEDYIIKDLEKKMVFLAGPRQVGKTTIARHILDTFNCKNYLNWDDDNHKKIILKREWLKNEKLVVFDELHKFHRWKNWLKGVYDTEGNKPSVLVTGSARLDIFRKHGDSMMGRYYHYRLHPISVKELSHSVASPFEALNSIYNFGGFPEPLMSGSEIESKRWRKDKMDRILRDDVVTLESIRNISALELLVFLLKERVGSTLSIRSLAEDLHVSPHTIESWIDILERMYVIFKVRPYSKSLSRAIKKEYKIYFFDIAEIDDPGIRFENLIACHLLKYAHFKEDTEGDRYELNFIRDKEQREIDFVLIKNRLPILLVEAKLSQEEFSKNLIYYKDKYFSTIKAVQVTKKNIKDKESSHGILLQNATDLLMELV